MTSWDRVMDHAIKKYMQSHLKEMKERADNATKLAQLLRGKTEVHDPMPPKKHVERTLEFKGIVSTGDECRVTDDESVPSGAILIGGDDVIDDIYDTFSGKVTATINGKEFSGKLSVEVGWGYSEWTPMDSDRLCVGDEDLIEYLGQFEGEEVEMRVTGFGPPPAEAT